MQHNSHLRRFRCVGGAGTAGGRCRARRRLPGQHHRGRGTVAAVDVIVSTSDSRVVRATRRWKRSDFLPAILYGDHALRFSTFFRAKSTTGTTRRERRPQRPADGHTLPSAGITRGVTRRRRPLSRRRSTTGGSVARRCYGDPKTSRRTRRKISFGSSDWGGCVDFQKPPSSCGGLRAAKGVRKLETGSFFLIFLHFLLKHRPFS